jgi:hypothetical protein
MSQSAISSAPIALLRIGPPRELVAEHRQPEALDRERRLPDHVALGELMDRRLDRLGLPLAGALADALDAVVGVDLREHPVAPAGPDQEGLDPGHAAVLGHRLAPSRSGRSDAG